MSNYLGNLVARILNQAEVIQPRPVSYFEAWPMAGMVTAPFPIPAITGAEELAGEATSSAALPRPGGPSLKSDFPTLPSPAPPRPSLLPEPPLWPATAPSAGAMLSPPEPVVHRPLPSTTADRPAAVEAVHPPLPDQPPAPAPIRPVEARKRRLANNFALANELVEESVIPSMARNPQAPGNSRRFTSQDDHADVLEKTHPSPVPAGVPVRPLPTPASQPAAEPAPGSQLTIDQSRLTIFQPQIRPYAGPPAPLVAPEPEPAATIQVTIGRIEVRATPPAPLKAVKEQRHAPVMSLDDYLQQRNGGRQ